MITNNYSSNSHNINTNSRCSGDLKKDNIANKIQNFIKETYQIPCKEDSSEITFLYHGETKNWGKLSHEQKGAILISNALPHHNKEEIAANPEKMLMSPKFADERKKHEEMVPLDPRRAHGVDHAVRAGIYAPVFASLYNTYHPNANMTNDDVLVAIFSAVGHDSMRQSEGLDIYDEASAKRVGKELSDDHVSHELVEEGEEAIERKDSEPNAKKPFIAKCVQCSDSAEFSRFCSPSRPWNPEKTDIYVELKNFKSLKNGSTFEEFNATLNKVTKEMNQFTSDTFNTAVRLEASQSDNYFKNFLNRIENSSSYPVLKQILKDQNIL